MKEKTKVPGTVYCPTCKKDVKYIKKVFNVKLCPSCNKILASDIPMERVGR